MNRYHITKAYGFIKNKSVSARQDIIANLVIASGYNEMGIYNYESSGETQPELAARIKGISASVATGDFIFIQLPTGNDINFEITLLQTIHSIPNVKIILIWHSFGYFSKHKDELSIYADYDVIPQDVCMALKKNKWHIHKLLIDAIAKIDRPCESTIDATDMIQIGMGVYDKTGNYTSWLGVAILSAIKRSSAPICFHIVCDETLTETNRLRLTYICHRNGHDISFHQIDAKVFVDFNSQMRKYTVGALFRILLPQICSNLSKIIYLDSDLLINCDIKELWETDISNYCIAAVPDEPVVKGIAWTKPTSIGAISKETYFNSGVLYMNLDKIRKKGNLLEMMSTYLKENPDSNLPDQDALNVIFNKETLLLDKKWNVPIEINRIAKNTDLRECIYHYIGTCVVPYVGGEIDRLYMDIAKQTPWGIKFYTSILKRSLNRQNLQLRNLERIKTLLTEGNKKLIFYGSENASMKKLYEILNVKDHEAYRILKKPDNGGIIPCSEFDILNNMNRGSFIIFALIQADSGNALRYLNEIGLEIEKDYFVIQNIMDFENGGFIV